MTDKALDVAVDIVYLWVDSDDPAFQESIESCYPGVLKRKANNYRNNNELLYSLRSIRKNFNYRKIFIVTNGQTPPFIDFSHPDICLVKHSEIFTTSEHLPTFNSMAIEAHLHRIPGLSDRFVYLNDDFFICTETPVSYLEGLDGQGMFHFARKSLQETPPTGWNFILQGTEAALRLRYGDVSRNQMTHTPQFFNKNTCEKVAAVWQRDLESTSASGLRRPGNVFFRMLYAYFVAYERCGVQHIEELVKETRSDCNFLPRRYYQSVASPFDVNTVGKEILEMPPRFLSIQDNGADQMNTPLDAFLASLFPVAAPWELSL